MGSIQEYFQEYKEKYNIFKPIINNIIRFEFTDGKKYSNLPCYFERGFIRKGRDIEKENAIYTYGFDDKNKLIYIKCGNYKEEFLVYFDDAIYLYSYDSDIEDENKKILGHIQISELDNDGLFCRTILVNKWGNVCLEKYYYEFGRIVKIENPIEFEYGTYNDILEIEYDICGNIMQIVDEESWLANGIVYKKVNYDEVEGLRKKVINKITENIIADVINRYSNRNDKICYISLEVHEEPHTVLSAMYSRIAFESERDKYILENGIKYEKSICDYSNNSIIIYDKQLEIECNTLIHHYIRYNDCYKECEKITNDIIAKLKDFQWQNYILISENFEVLEPLKYD